jgi:hypothetical protein
MRERMIVGPDFWWAFTFDKRCTFPVQTKRRNYNIKSVTIREKRAENKRIVNHT